MEGYFTGVMDLYYAKMLTEDTISSPPVYDVPKLLAGSIDTKITPVYAEGKRDVSNQRVRNTKRVVGYAVKLDVDKIRREVQREAFGRVVDEAGVQLIRKANDPPNVALALVYTLDDGTKEYWWLYKGKFAEPEKAGKTEEQDKLDYVNASLEGIFVPRIDTGDIAAVVDDGDDEIAATVFQTWLLSVYEPDALAQPDVDELPIGAVDAVAALPTTGISETTVYVLTAADGAKAAGTMWRRIAGAWVEYGAA